MIPTQQIIPGHRSSDGRMTSGRPTSIDISRSMSAHRPQPETSVNYSALLRRHRNAVLSLLGGTLLLAVLYTLVAHKTYKSVAILEVMGQNGEFMNTKDVDPTASTVSGQDYIETQMKLLTSPPVLQRTAEILGPQVPSSIVGSQGVTGRFHKLFGGSTAPTAAEAEAVVYNMVSGAKPKEDGTSDLITLTLTGPDAKLTADAANTLTEQFIEHAQEVRMNSAGSTNKFLASELADARKKLQSSEDDLQAYAKQTGIVIPSESQESVAAEKLRQIQSDLTKAESDEAESKAQAETSTRSPADVLPQVLDDQTMRDNRARLSDLRRQLSDLSVTLTPANYKIQQLNAEIAELEAANAKQRANIVRRLGVQNSETERRKQLLGAAYQAQLGVRFRPVG